MWIPKSLIIHIPISLMIALLSGSVIIWLTHSNDILYKTKILLQHLYEEANGFFNACNVF